MKKLILTVFSFIAFSFLMFSQESIQQNGYNKFYYPNGSLQSEGNMVNGKPEGYWINYYPTGVKKSEGRRKNFLLDSTWVFYSITGDTIQKINYLDGKKNGYTYDYYSTSNRVMNGTLKSKELFVNNEKEGLCYYYYENGLIQRIDNYEKNLLEGNSIEYDTDGRIITVLKYRRGTVTEREKINRYSDSGNKNGLWREFYSNDKIKIEAYYKDGLLNGYYKEYDEKGSLKLTLLYQNGVMVSNVDDTKSKAVEVTDTYNNGVVKHVGSYINDMPVGIHKEYKTDGTIDIVIIYNDNSEVVERGIVDDDGKRIGGWEAYYNDGKILSKGNYKNNLRDGKWDFFYKNGVKEQTGEFVNGKYNGVWKWYYPEGQLWKEEEFFSGKEEGYYTEYDLDGNIIVQGEYIDGEKDGEWTTKINDNKAVGKYVNGMMDGKWRYYYDNGNILFEGNFIQGNADGKHKYFYSDGTLKEEQYFNQGIKYKHWKKYNTDGELIITITYKDDKEYRINGIKVDLEDNSPTVLN